MAIEDFYNLMQEFEMLQCDLQDAWESDSTNRKRRREILRRMRVTLAAMHEEHRRWLDSRAEINKVRPERKHRSKHAQPHVDAA